VASQCPFTWATRSLQNSNPGCIHLRCSSSRARWRIWLQRTSPTLALFGPATAPSDEGEQPWTFLNSRIIRASPPQPLVPLVPLVLACCSLVLVVGGMMMMMMMMMMMRMRGTLNS